MADHPYAVPDAQGPCTACVNGWRTCPSSAVAHFKFCRDNDDDEYELDSQWVGPGDVTVPCTDDDDPHPAEPDPVPPDWLRVNETTVTDEQTGLSKTWYYLQNTLTGETVGPYSE